MSLLLSILWVTFVVLQLSTNLDLIANKTVRSQIKKAKGLQGVASWLRHVSGYQHEPFHGKLMRLTMCCFPNRALRILLCEQKSKWFWEESQADCCIWHVTEYVHLV